MPRLTVVQSHPTQFDGPFYRFIARKSDIDLTVFYYRYQGEDGAFDPEMGRRCKWDHDVVSGYTSIRKPRGLRGSIGFFRRFRRIVASAGPGSLVIVSGYNSVFTLLAALICRLTGKPVGLRSDNVLREFDSSSWRAAAKTRILPLLFRLFTTGHPVGSLAKEYMLSFGFRKESLFRFRMELTTIGL